MIKYYNSVNNVVMSAAEPSDGSWVSLVSPTEQEINYVIAKFNLDAGFVRSALDEEESSRIESEENQTLIIVDYPVAETEPASGKFVGHYTLPMGIIITHKNVITITLKDNIIIDEMAEGVIKNVNVSFKTRFVLLILSRIAARFVTYLKEIDKLTSFTEKQLHKSMKNKELFQLISINKSLVYFSTSLKADQVTLERILRGRIIRLYEEDKDLLEDVLIEIGQATEMAQIFTHINGGMIEGLGAIINNNMNSVVRSLTVMTILMQIPSIIFGFYGMNVEKLPFVGTPLFAVITSVTLVFVAALILKRK